MQTGAFCNMDTGPTFKIGIIFYVLGGKSIEKF